VGRGTCCCKKQKAPAQKVHLAAQNLLLKIITLTHGDVGVVVDGGGGGSNLHGAQFNLSPVIYKGHKFESDDPAKVAVRDFFSAARTRIMAD
jgi:hypothetical protein